MFFFFSRPEMLWGLLLCFLPGIIYWLRRRNVSVIRWGAMRFLRKAQEKVRYRNRLREIVVLTLQTLAILCVILASAGIGTRKETKNSVSGERNSDLWLVDVSESMNAQKTGTLETRGEMCEKFIPKGQTVISVSDWCNVPELPGHGISNITLLSDCPNEPDFTKFLTSLAEKTPSASHRLISVFTSVSNICISDLELMQTPALVNQKQALNLTVKNDSNSSIDAVCVEFVLERKDVKSSVLTLEKGEKWLKLLPHAEVQVQWEVVFPEAGEYQVTARLKTQDGFPRDDSYTLEVQAKNAARFLIAESFQSGSNVSRMLETESSPCLRAALSAIFSARCPEVPIEKILGVESVYDADFSSLDLTGYDAVFLLNIPFFTEAEALNLRTYVQNGGSLWAIPGNQTEGETFSALADFLPAVTTGEMKMQSDDETRNVTPKISSEPHRVTELFVRNPQSGLETVPIFNWFSLKQASDSTVVLELSTGDPLLVLRDFGLGRTAITAIPADSRSSALPLLPVWVPLVDQVLHFLTTASGTKSALNCPVEESLLLNKPCEPASIPLSWEFQTFSPKEAGEVGAIQYLLPSLLCIFAACAFFIASLLKRV